ncbi:MAG: hypothetical protein ACTHXA_02275 [Gulosibacter sp.]|uniref:hypothetical protein n=1 Tax=Gulosibacter sp. TaxID=2817531 RepID=UPI003F8DBCAF
MTESLMITPVTKEYEKLRARRGQVLRSRELFAAGDQVAAKDGVRQIGLAS